MKDTQIQYLISITASTSTIHDMRESLVKKDDKISPQTGDNSYILTVGHTTTNLFINIMADEMPINYFRKLAKMYKVPFEVYSGNQLVRSYNGRYRND